MPNTTIIFCAAFSSFPFFAGEHPCLLIEPCPHTLLVYLVQAFDPASRPAASVTASRERDPMMPIPRPVLMPGMPKQTAKPASKEPSWKLEYRRNCCFSESRFGVTRLLGSAPPCSVPCENPAYCRYKSTRDFFIDECCSSHIEITTVVALSYFLLQSAEAFFSSGAAEAVRLHHPMCWSDKYFVAF